MSDFHAARENFNDRMQAVRHALVNASLPLTALNAAMGHAQIMINEMVKSKPTTGDMTTLRNKHDELTEAVVRFLVADAITAKLPPHIRNAETEERREAHKALCDLVSFDPRYPRGIPVEGAQYTHRLNQRTYTVLAVFDQNGGKLVGMRNSEGEAGLFALDDFHQFYTPTPTKE